MKPKAMIEVSIRTPREGRDANSLGDDGDWYLFQSARPARGATGSRSTTMTVKAVSIRTPREGRDSLPRVLYPDDRRFQSARPARGATGCRLVI